MKGEHDGGADDEDKGGKTRSVGVRPFHWAWFMKRQEPGRRCLLTMIMKAMVMPRSTSSESRRWTGVAVDAGFAMGMGRGAVMGCAMPITLRAWGWFAKRDLWARDGDGMAGLVEAMWPPPGEGLW